MLVFSISRMNNGCPLSIYCMRPLRSLVAPNWLKCCFNVSYKVQSGGLARLARRALRTRCGLALGRCIGVLARRLFMIRRSIVVLIVVAAIPVRVVIRASGIRVRAACSVVVVALTVGSTSAAWHCFQAFPKQLLQRLTSE